MLSSKETLLNSAGSLRSASQAIHEIIGFKKHSQSLLNRATRLEKNLFTVALFGAFSAGKSSFANALMGEMVLPVSPNPTTAAINRILPSNADNPHGTVRVKLKTITDMTADVQDSLKVFELSSADLQDSIGKIITLTPENIAPTAKPHFSFLKAFVKGYSDIAPNLGQEITVDLSAFKNFVAKEEKACFVEWIELYYDCPLTMQGIMLVDTPGSDSINARHTGVAFEYIKNADAVLFVTYYNNAFSNADKEFLIQLGRVKSTMEKEMFFIVNAADLAKTTEELNEVVTHIKTNLLACSISQPRIYPVSSQTALLAKLHKADKLQNSTEKIYRQRLELNDGESLPLPEVGITKSGLDVFEKDFIHFTINELVNIAVLSAKQEIIRAQHALQEFLDMAMQNEADRGIILQKYHHLKENALSTVSDYEWSIEKRSITNEIAELTYYVRERILRRYHDNFNLTFNPAALRSEGQDVKKQLQFCLDEILRFISFELMQEMRATTLRIEKFINKTSLGLYEKILKEVQMKNEHLEFEPYAYHQLNAPNYQESMFNFIKENYFSVLNLFKNGTDFFVRDGKAVMREKLQEMLKNPLGGFIDRETDHLSEHYIISFDKLILEIKDDINLTIDEYFAGLTAALTLQTNTATLQNTLDLLKTLTI